MQVTKFNLVTDLQIMLSNVTHSHFQFECNTERGFIEQLYIELGKYLDAHLTINMSKRKKNAIFSVLIEDVWIEGKSIRFWTLIAMKSHTTLKKKLSSRVKLLVFV